MPRLLGCVRRTTRETATEPLEQCVTLTGTAHLAALFGTSNVVQFAKKMGLAYRLILPNRDRKL